MLDSLIIGQGLAGTLLAWHLIERGERVLVVDNGLQSASSKVAAGLINPVTGKRLVKTVGLDQCLPYAREFYRQLETHWGAELWVDLPMLRLFHSAKERERWEQRCREPGYEAYLGATLGADELPAPVVASHGAGQQLQTAYLKTEELLEAGRAWLQTQSSYQLAQFDYSDLRLGGDGVCWGDVSAHRVIFCEGYKGAQNPWFDWLPFQPAKGEFLSVSCDEPLPQLIINSGRWIMPRGKGNYRIGASYDHDNLNEQVSEETRKMLLGAVAEFFGGPPVFTIEGQQAGVRPTTSDRQPFIGRHPEHSALYMFNGFGSKGSLLIPWHVNCFVENLLDGKALPQPVDVARYQEHGDG